MSPLRPTPDRGLTLVELLVVCAIIGVLAAMFASAVFGVFDTANRAACASNLRQLGMALQAYLKDNQGQFFPLRVTEPDGVLWYFGFETGASAGSGEGRRRLDRTRARLYPYLGSEYATVEVCPAFPYDGPYKAKYDSRWWTYGINYEMCNHKTSRNFGEIRPRDQGRTLIFADSAQVNTFQAPASPTHPLIEEWIYIQTGARFVHFRHGGLANVLFADWHVEALPPAPGSYDPRMPDARIGWLDPARVILKPGSR